MVARASDTCYVNLELLDNLIEQDDYQSCVQWYIANGKDSFLQLLIEDDTAKTFAQRLYSTIRLELEKIQAAEDPIIQTNYSLPESAPQESNETKDVLATLKYEAGQWFKKMKTARLGTFSEDKETRRKAALETLEYQRKNKEKWKDIEFYKDNGYLPGEAAQLSLKQYSVKELFAEIKKLENYIRKYSKKQREEGISDHVETELIQRKTLLLKLQKEIEKR